MNNPSLPEISIERLLSHNIPEYVSFRHDIVMVSKVSDLNLFSHPARMKAITVLICLGGRLECSVNLKNFVVGENQILVNFAGDIICIERAEGFEGYVMVFSEEYLQNLNLDFRVRTHGYLNLRGNGPMTVPRDEIQALYPYYQLFRKNMEEGRQEILRELTRALSHTLMALMVRSAGESVGMSAPVPRAQQIFDRFMELLDRYHTSERTASFYASKMCLTPKYVSHILKEVSGKCALDWINDYVMIEARMMLRYTQMSVQEISYRLNFPTQSAFGKYFRQQEGMSPREYRRLG